MGTRKKERQKDAIKERQGRGEAAAEKKSKGNTMVEVIVSFAILTMLAAVFSNVFMTGSRAVVRAVRLMEEKEALYEAYHLGEGVQAERIGGGSIRFERVDGDGWEDGFILDRMEVYGYTSTEGLAGIVYDVGAKEER